MKAQDHINYYRIAEAIDFIKQNFREQPTLNDIADQVHLSPYHFQRMFTNWAGVSPKKFMQYISVEHAKRLLKEQDSTLFETAHQTGLSGTGRLHDLFINIEGMTPGEFKNGGENLLINYSIAESPFGNLVVASTSKGICYMEFTESLKEGVSKLKQRFPNARFTQVVDTAQQNALFIFQHDWSKLSTIKLHLSGTPFQIKVWETLLKIPMGRLATYGSIANEMNNPKSARAVGSAIANNPIAYLIPCHRVIQSTGKTGNYKWGELRKSAIIGWEIAKTLN